MTFFSCSQLFKTLQELEMDSKELAEILADFFTPIIENGIEKCFALYHAARRYRDVDDVGGEPLRPP